MFTYQASTGFRNQCIASAENWRFANLCILHGLRVKRQAASRVVDCGRMHLRDVCQIEHAMYMHFLLCVLHSGTLFLQANFQFTAPTPVRKHLDENGLFQQCGRCGFMHALSFTNWYCSRCSVRDEDL